MVELFELGYRLDYKKGQRPEACAGPRSADAHLESIPELRRIATTPGPGG